MNMTILKLFNQHLKTLNKILELKTEAEELQKTLPDELRLVVFHEELETVAKPSPAKRAARVNVEEVQEAIRAAFKAAKGKMTKDQLEAATGHDSTRLTNAMTKMKNEIESVAADDKMPKSPRNTAYELKKAKK